MPRLDQATAPHRVVCSDEMTEGVEAKGIGDREHAHHFHKWYRDQPVAYGQSLPQDGTGFSDELVDKLIRAEDRKQIPSGQYRAILIDEGLDSKPAWFKLVAQMVDPLTNSLLVLYDDAQNSKLPYQVRRGTGPGNFNPLADSIKLMAMHASKGLEFAVVALPGIGQMPMRSADERSETRLFYVAATRATHRLLVTVSGQGGFGQRLAPANLQ